MAATEFVITGNKGFSYAGLNRSHDKNFRLNNFDVELRVCKSDGTYTATTNYTSTLKKVLAGVVVDSTDTVLTSCVVTPGEKGAYSVTNLNSLGANAVAVIKIIGSRN